MVKLILPLSHTAKEMVIRNSSPSLSIYSLFTIPHSIDLSESIKISNLLWKKLHFCQVSDRLNISELFKKNTTNKTSKQFTIKRISKTDYM